MNDRRNVPLSIQARGPLPYKSHDEAIAAYLRHEMSEGILAWFLDCDIVDTRRAVMQYHAQPDTEEES